MKTAIYNSYSDNMVIDFLDGLYIRLVLRLEYSQNRLEIRRTNHKYLEAMYDKDKTIDKLSHELKIKFIKGIFNAE